MENAIKIHNENFTTIINKDEIVIKKEIITLETLKNNLIKKLNENVGNLDSYKSEIELLKIILELKKD